VSSGKIFGRKYALKSIFMNQKVKQLGDSLIIFMAFTHIKKMILGHLISQDPDQTKKCPDPTGSGSESATLLNLYIFLWCYSQEEGGRGRGERECNNVK
jgi:hypothetical protein